MRSFPYAWLFRVQGMKYLQDIRRSIIPDDIPILEQGIEDVLKDDGVVN